MTSTDAAELAVETAARLDNLEAPDPDELVGVRSLAIPLDTQKALAANADLYAAAFALVEQWGFQVRYADGWRGRSASYTLAKLVRPSAVIVHHTAGNNTPTDYILRGDPLRGLTGPLANVHVTRDDVAHVLGVGYQNHAGNGDKACWDRIAGGTAPLDRDLVPGPDGAWSANRYAVAIEANGDGGEDDWTPGQRALIVAINAAFHLACGWSLDGKTARTGAHKELTRRKPGDPVANLGSLRRDVAAFIAAKQTPAPPSAAADTLSRVWTFNTLDTRFSGTWASRRSLVIAAIKQAGGSIGLLTECSETQRDDIRAALGAAWKVWVRGSQAILFDSRKWGYSASRSIEFGPTAYHGAIIATLTNKATGRKLQAAAFHLPPKAVADETYRRTAFRKLLEALDPSIPTLLGGDANTSAAPTWAAATGFTEARTAAAKKAGASKRTHDPYVDGSPIDHLLGRDLGWRWYANVDAGGGSDHQIVSAGLTIPADVSPL